MQILEMTISGVIILGIVFQLLLARSEPNCHGFRTWLKVCCGIYLADLIVCLNQLMFIKKTGKENYIVFGICILICGVNTGWYSYGNYIYFNYQYECFGPNSEDADTLTQSMLLMIMFGYLTMLKCCCYTMMGCILIPVLCCLYRRAQQPNWEGAAPSIVKDLAKGKFQATPENNMDSCSICMVDFTEEDQVVTLPCNSKHIFHDECIKRWLTQKNSCPLCNTQITKEMLREQRQTN